MEHHSISYIVGMVCGFVASFAFIWLCSLLIRKAGGKFGFRKCGKQSQYDERQLQARGKAYKAGFFFMIVYVMVASILADQFGIRVLMSSGGMWIGVCAALLLFATICIWEDAYMSLQENARGINMMFVLVGVLNLIPAVKTLQEGAPFIEHDVISFHYTNLVCVILFFALTLIFDLKLLYNKAQEENED